MPTLGEGGSLLRAEFHRATARFFKYKLQNTKVFLRVKPFLNDLDKVELPCTFFPRAAALGRGGVSFEKGWHRQPFCLKRRVLSSVALKRGVLWNTIATVGMLPLLRKKNRMAHNCSRGARNRSCC